LQFRITQLSARLHIRDRKLATVCGAQGDQGLSGDFRIDLRLQFLTVVHLS